MSGNATIDVVVIGLNGAAMLETCLRHVAGSVPAGKAVAVFYSDSGSRDNSREIAAAVRQTGQAS